MPATAVHFYRELDGSVPVLEWLMGLRVQDPRAYASCRDVISRLAAQGHELRRPKCDYLRDGLYELRARRGRVQYRIIYFFCGRDIAILAHGLTKEAAVPQADIQRALARKMRYEKDSKTHRYEEATGPPVDR